MMATIMRSPSQRLLVTRLLAIGFGLLLALAGAEATVRVFGLSKTLAMQSAAGRRPPRAIRSVAARYMPNARWSGPYDVPYRSNSDGYREREFSVVKPAGVVRIAMLGDSVSEGLGVAEEQRFSRRLEELLQGDRSTIEVLDFAMAGYATVDEKIALERDALRYAPDRIILQICFDDVAENRERSGSGPSVE